MNRRSSLAAALTLAILPCPALAQPPRERADYPHLRAALHELREANLELKESREPWPAGHKERAAKALQDATNSLKTILSVNDVENFQGIARNPDHYKRFADFPRLRAALEDLRQARDELRGATADFKGMKERALDDIEVAIGEILTLTRTAARPVRPR